MRQFSIKSIHQSLAVMSLMALTLLLAGAGCSDNGSATGPGDDDMMPVDSVSFAEDVLPIFQMNCAGSSCHLGAIQPARNLTLENYQEVINGSTSGAVIVAGDAQNSELIRRLEARSTPSMPIGQDLLSTATIKVIRDWIDQGALDN